MENVKQLHKKKVASDSFSERRERILYNEYDFLNEIFNEISKKREVLQLKINSNEFSDQDIKSFEVAENELKQIEGFVSTRCILKYAGKEG